MTEETTTPAEPQLRLSLEFSAPGAEPKKYGGLIAIPHLVDAAEFARQTAEMVERTIATHLKAVPTLEEEPA